MREREDKRRGKKRGEREREGIKVILHISLTELALHFGPKQH